MMKVALKVWVHLVVDAEAIAAIIKMENVDIMNVAPALANNIVVVVTMIRNTLYTIRRRPRQQHHTITNMTKMGTLEMGENAVTILAEICIWSLQI